MRPKKVHWIRPRDQFQTPAVGGVEVKIQDVEEEGQVDANEVVLVDEVVAVENKTNQSRKIN